MKRELEKEEMLKNIDKLFDSSKHRTTDEQLHAAGEKAVEQLERKKVFGKLKNWKIDPQKFKDDIRREEAEDELLS